MGKKVCFAASSGGHFEQLLMLKDLMDKYDSFIVTEKTAYSATVEGRKMYFVNQVNRKETWFPLITIVNFFKSLRIYFKEKPDVIVTTGVLAIIPMCLVVKMFGGKLVYIESFAKVSTPTKTGLFLHKYADKFYVQWKDMLEIYPDATFLGGIY